MNLKENLNHIQNILVTYSAKLVAVSKTKPEALIQEAYDVGLRIFGENKAQELARKHQNLPKDIEWHMIGHLQTNKVKYIAPFVTLIHGVDSFKLLKEINKQGTKNNRVIDCLMQMHIANEETKFGLDENEINMIIQSEDFSNLQNIRIIGLMGMATNTSDSDKVRTEFERLKIIFDELNGTELPENCCMQELSMGMSGDFKIALQEGSTIVRVGSAIFGERNKNI